MRCEVVAVGTELLLGQVVDTNSSWIGEQLALAGIDSYFQVKVGDNADRIASALRTALDRSDAVLVCGGLGPTQDDITRDVIAEVMGVELLDDPVIEERIRAMFGSRGRDMPANNLRQAQVPEGAHTMAQQPGTAPGLVCPIGDPETGQVIYAVPGVPYEMKEMVEGTVHPRPAAAGGGAGGDPQPHAAHVGDERVGPGRGAGRPHRRARHAGPRHARLPGQRHRGAQGARHGQGAPPRRGRRRSWPARSTC